RVTAREVDRTRRIGRPVRLTDEEAPPDWSGGASSWWSVSSGKPDVGGLGTLLALRDLELNALTLFESAVTLGLDSRVVREDVLSAVVGGDEAESLFGVEPLHGSTRHVTAFFWCMRPLIWGVSST